MKKASLVAKKGVCSADGNSEIPPVTELCANQAISGANANYNSKITKVIKSVYFPFGILLFLFLWFPQFANNLSCTAGSDGGTAAKVVP
jgi:hypothetical protein